MFLSARTESTQRCAKGTPAMNTSPQAGVHRRRPPGPPYYGGRPPEKLLYPPGGPKTRSVLLLASAHWGLHGQKLKRFCAVRTPPTWAKPWQLADYAAPQGGTPEAKRSFAQSSFAYFSFKKSRAYFFLEKSKAQSQGNRAAGPTFNPAAWRISFTP